MTARPRLISPQLTAMMAAFVLAVLLCCNPTSAWSAPQPPMPSGLPAAVESASSYFMKSPAKQFSDEEARISVENFIAGL